MAFDATRVDGVCAKLVQAVRMLDLSYAEVMLYALPDQSVRVRTARTAALRMLHHWKKRADLGMGPGPEVVYTCATSVLKTVVDTVCALTAMHHLMADAGVLALTEGITA